MDVTMTSLLFSWYAVVLSEWKCYSQ